ncbi:hypothetical protein [Candidatus Xianfuyuplasma coldseepsis]|uniref:Uncharacterized protein n=1 Tax=Candidatus Xianfuyuplasma coldseepsis TaxID=2782163 RepID=A0A7L7KT51_9MOLU|nr:hypothetical protein [Xianfuyuplasma coldseepsis]QMS85923.1 hypothetical protein G4Z02_09240 [Xianfuyuplasma coldseepsis]
MLNRRLSDYIFYGSLAAILIGVLLLRVLIVGTMNTNIENLRRDNANLALQIDALEILVQENKNVQTSHLYELYDIIPNVYSEIGLKYKTASMLEELGVNKSDEFGRSINVSTTVNLGNVPTFQDYEEEYLFVQVEVQFQTDDTTIVTDFIDKLYNSEQLFIVNQVDYTDTTGEYSMEMRITFLAVYDVELIEES